MNNIISTHEYVINNSIFRIGKVVEIMGQSVKVDVDSGKNTSSILYKGEIIQNVSVGSYVKIKKDFEEIVGIIEGEVTKEDKEFSKKQYAGYKDKISRVLSIKILGYLNNGTFVRGIKELPLIDNTCFLITSEEFNYIHQFVDNNDKPIKIGKLEFNDSVDISLGVNKLFASHIGIFGNTGSGKSYTLAKIYRQLFEKFENNKNFKNKSEFLIIDFNGEYIDDAVIGKDRKNCYDLTTSKEIQDIRDEEKLPIDLETIKNVSFWAIFLSATEKTQQPFLARTIKKSDIVAGDIKDLISEVISNENRNVEKGVIFNFLDSIGKFLENELKVSCLREKLRYHSNNNTYYLVKSSIEMIYANDKLDKVLLNIKEILGEIKIKSLTEIEAIKFKIIFHYYSEIVKGYANIEHLSPLIKRLEKRILDLNKVIIVKNDNKESQKNLTVVSLRNVNMDIRKMLPMLLVKDLYDKKKKENYKNKSLHIIVDEAHNILSSTSNRESEEWKDYRLETFEEIIKEGRKFNVFMTIASQRPADISATIISQLHNYFIHRLVNNNDLLAVEKTIAYLDKVSADFIPNLETGTCILAGIMAKIPVVIKVDKITKQENQPQSQNIDLIEQWNKNAE